VGHNWESAGSESATHDPAAALGVLTDEDAHARVQVRVWLRRKSAEVGKQQAYRALEEAERVGASERELERLSGAFEQEAARAIAAQGCLDALGR
jgi:hypothetical protein